jgi:hypothetical protein
MDYTRNLRFYSSLIKFSRSNVYYGSTKLSLQDEDDRIYNIWKLKTQI